LSKREEEIENTIRSEVFIGCFGTGNFRKGKVILRKLYGQYYPYLNNFETKRLILYNYIVAESMEEDKNEEILCKLIIQLKNDMDTEPNYKENFTGKYLDMMSYYTDCKGIKLSNKELLDYHDFSYNYWKNRYESDNDIECYMWMQIAKFDKEKLLKNFRNILEIIKDIHTINNKQTVSTEKRMLNEVKKLDEQLYTKALDIINEKIMINCI
jgi:hypothetical protein